MDGLRWSATFGRRGRVGGSCLGFWAGKGAEPKVSGNFYKAVDQEKLLFGAETWVLTQRTEKALDSFQSRVARRLTGKQPRRNKDGSWDYPPLAEVMREARLEGIRKSITRR